MTSSLERARAAFARQAWADACKAFAQAAAEGDAVFTMADHERWAVASYLVGADDACEQAWEAAQRTAVEAGDHAEATRCAVLLALCLVLRGQMARAGGWLGRAESLLAAAGDPCAAAGYVLLPRIVGALEAGEYDGALELGRRAADIGRQFGDADLLALGLLGEGQARIRRGEAAAGLARLDELMVAVAGGDVGPIVSGIAYCTVIIESLKVFDLARASEWTAALDSWCDTQPGLVPFRGQCLVHRSQLHLAAGEWPQAATSIEVACDHLADPPHPALGLAFYQRAELHRVQGDVDTADADYRSASRHGHDPMPGLALLDLARGEPQAAAASIRRALDETPRPPERTPLLAAAVDILRAAGDVDGARAAAEELTSVARASTSAVLRAMAGQATGTVLLAEGDPAAALRELREAARAWQALRMPYEAARTAVSVALACAAMGDRTTAAVELDNARAAFARLGAHPDLARLDGLARAVVDAHAGPPADSPAATAAGLSEREREVLAHLAAGETNREIAEALVISPHTVGRHVENIFAKLGVGTRAAATAYAYEHGLL